MAEFLAALPLELQYYIIEECDIEDISVLCRTSKDMNARFTPVLWAHIDFVAARWYMSGDDTAREQMRFFAACDTLMKDRPERWSELACHVRVLRLLKVPGIGITQDYDEKLDDILVTWGDGNGSGAVTNIYEIIGYFHNLEVLSLFVKHWSEVMSGEGWGFNFVGDLTKLRSLKIGGQVFPTVLRSLLSMPENIDELSLINLIGDVGQGERPPPVFFISPIQHRFSQLKTLHLSKLTRVHEGREDDLGMNWECEDESEQQVLSEWSGLLENVSETLVDLVLENSFHDFTEYNDDEDEDDDQGAHPTYRGLLFPIFAGKQWPNLQRLIFIGIDMLGATQNKSETFDCLDPEVEVALKSGSHVNYYYDATPLVTSPPEDLFPEN